jgi:ribosomal protein S18 acetylase RimI-like enzyme
MNGLEIRLLSESDADCFWQLRLRALKEEPESFGAAYEESAATAVADVTKRLRSSNDSFVLGAFTPTLVGMLGFYRRQGIKMRHKGTIWGMYVAPEGRGRGAGRALMLAAIERASATPDIEQLVLTVVTTNEAARKLYLSMGFQPYGLEMEALKVGNRFLDEEMMALKLRP